MQKAKKQKSKQLIVEALYLDLEDLKQSKSDGDKRNYINNKSLLGASVKQH